MATTQEEEYVIPKLADFHISEKTGFLLEEPLLTLPAYFEPWEKLGRNVANLLETHSLRDEVHKMPLLDHEQLSGYRQWRLAYTFLSFIGNGYVWQEGQIDPTKILPRQLAIPWFGVSRHLGLEPGVCLACSVHSNWKVVDPSRPLSVDNMECLCTFRGGSHCHWFFMTTGQIEMDVVEGLKAILKAKECSVSGDIDGVRQSLEAIADNLKLLKRDATRIHEHVDSDVFFNQIVPYLAGWGENTPLPEGVIFEGVSEIPRQVISGSAAQSTTLQCFDAALGITHHPDKQKFLDDIRKYMPASHAEFVLQLRKAPSIRQFVTRCHDEDVVNAYEDCVRALADFRSYHIQLTTKYTVSKSKTKTMGSAGTELTPFLKSIRDSTTAAVDLSS